MEIKRQLLMGLFLGCLLAGSVRAAKVLPLAITEVMSLPDTSQKPIFRGTDFWELSAIFDRPSVTSVPKYELSFGITTGLQPSSTTQKYEKRLGWLEQELKKELGETVLINLKLFKMGSRDDELLAQGKADFMLVSAVNYLRAKENNPGIIPLATEGRSHKCVFFARTDSGLTNLEQLRGKTVAFPDPASSISIHAQAQLAGARVFRTNLVGTTNFVDQGPAQGKVLANEIEPLVRVLKREYDAGATSRKLFEEYQFSKLATLDTFADTPDVYAKAAKPNWDSRFAQAFQKAISRALNLTLIDDSYFDNFRLAMVKAHQFEVATPSELPLQ
jgi:hypothetical protein